MRVHRGIVPMSSYFVWYSVHNVGTSMMHACSTTTLGNCAQLFAERFSFPPGQCSCRSANSQATSLKQWHRLIFCSAAAISAVSADHSSAANPKKRTSKQQGQWECPCLCPCLCTTPSTVKEQRQWGQWQCKQLSHSHSRRLGE